MNKSPKKIDRERKRETEKEREKAWYADKEAACLARSLTTV
jgi:hypothetical protein